MMYQPHIEDAREVLTDDEIFALMPRSFSCIAELIGLENTLNLIKYHGGALIFVPSKHALNIQHELSQAIGLKGLRTLSEYMGGERMEVPMGTLITAHMRNRLICDAVNSKKEPNHRVARKFGVTQRTVRAALKAQIKQREKNPNLDLFE